MISQERIISYIVKNWRFVEPISWSLPNGAYDLTFCVNHDNNHKVTIPYDPKISYIFGYFLLAETLDIMQHNIFSLNDAVKDVEIMRILKNG